MVVVMVWLGKLVDWTMVVINLVVDPMLVGDSMDWCGALMTIATALMEWAIIILPVMMSILAAPVLESFERTMLPWKLAAVLIHVLGDTVK
jgi:hypothetical protein